MPYLCSDKRPVSMMKPGIFLLLSALFLLCGCHHKRQAPACPPPAEQAALPAPFVPSPTLSPETSPAHTTAKSRMAHYLDSLGFINIADADSSIAVELMYTRPDNFTGQALYEDLHEAYLHPEAMKSLSQAQRLLKELRPGYSLIVYDAARPLSVQQKMWDKVKGTPRYIYVSNPARGGGLHNYGLAVDVSILTPDGTPLPMGTPVDYLGKEAHITDEARLVAQGSITPQERENRLLLRRVMKEAGFRPLPTEWWHFNRYGRQTAREKYAVIP